MAKTDNIRWTDALIEEKILECIEGLSLKRMPSRNEIRGFYGDDALTNKINKTLGYYGWADRLGLAMKNSDTQTGKIGERMATKWLQDLGMDVQQMAQNYPYDLYVNGCVKVDVKYSNLYKGEHGNYFSFRLAKQIPTCDIYLLIAHKDKDSFAYYVVPSREVMQLQISIGEHNSVYERYKNRADLIVGYENAFRNVV